MIVTIDGPSGTGKTTIAKRVAEGLHFSYFDTGAMYRSLTWLLLQNKIDLADELRIKEQLDRFSFIVQEQGGAKHYFVGGCDVTREIRSPEVTSAVSQVSAHPIVREALWKIQRDFGSQGNAVFEGRDLGTVVFPEADLKIFLTARPEVRAERRLKEVAEKNPGVAIDHDQMLRDLMRRDHLDSTRTLAPLKCPEDAYLIDTSDLSIDQVVAAILEHVK
jgi:cytidylate kinase